MCYKLHPSRAVSMNDAPSNEGSPKAFIFSLKIWSFLKISSRRSFLQTFRTLRFLPGIFSDRFEWTSFYSPEKRNLQTKALEEKTFNISMVFGDQILKIIHGDFTKESPHQRKGIYFWHTV